MSLRYRLAAVILAAITLAGSAMAQEWSRFRGPNGSGVSESTSLPSEFGPDQNLHWAVEIPFARSSPVFAGDRIFLTGIDGDKFSILALDRNTGAKLWHREIERNRTDEFYKDTDSATPSPVTDGSNVYAFFQETGLVAYSASGEKIWELGLGPFRNFYGMAASPVLVGNTLLLLCDQAMGSYLLAVDKTTGKELWRQQRPVRLESYTTPILYPDAAHPQQIIVSGSRWIDAYDPTSGESLWFFNGVGSGPVSSPVLAGNILYVNAPDHAAEPLPPLGDLAQEHDANKDERLSKPELEGTWLINHFGYLDADGDGSITTQDWQVLNAEFQNDHWGMNAIRLSDKGGAPQALWNTQQSVPYIPSPLVYDGVLYMVKDGIVSSLDPETGELHKRGRLTKGSPKVYASPVAADGKIYIGILGGQIAVLQAGAQWEVLAMNDLQDEIWATPAIADGHLYVRTRGKLFSFAAPKKAEASVSP